jgi:hypothetical protein
LRERYATALCDVSLIAGAGVGRFCHWALSTAALRHSAPGIGGEMIQSEFYRINFQIGRDLVDKAFSGKTGKS